MALRIMVGVAVLALAAPGLAGANEPFDSARGGGQVVLSGEDLTRAGNTIAFTAQNRGTATSGQVQFVETSLAGNGTAPPRWHGTPSCLRVDGNTAEIGGVITIGERTGEYFSILVVDNGTPGEDGGVDTIMMQYADDAPDCEADWDDADELTLARGNVTVNDADEA